MKKQKNATRVIAIVLVLLMALALIPIAASAQTFTINFYPNGGTIPADDPENPLGYVTGETTDGEVNGDYTVLAFSAYGIDPPAHHEFVHWNPNADDSGDEYYVQGQTFTINQNWALYAIWDQILVDVTFESGSHGTSTVSSLDDQYAGSNIQLPPWSGEIDDHWNFAGWKYGSTTYQPSVNFELPDSDVTFVAQWLGDEVSVSYASGGATGGSEPASPPAGTYAYGGGFPLPECSWTKTGNMFIGWTVGSGENTILQQPGAQLDWTKVTDANTLPITATWAETVTISYDADGGLPAPAADVIPKGGTLDSLPEVSKTGSDFQGWYDGENLVSAPVTTSTNLFLVAHWLSNTIPVTFDHGTGTGTKADTTAPRTGTYSPLPDATDFTAPTDCVFGGWKISVNGAAAGDTVYPAGGSFTVPAGAEALKLIAQWKNTKIIVTYKKNGGTGMDDQQQNMSSVTPIALTKLSELGITASSSEYVFLGWNTVQTATEPIFEDGESIVWDSSDPAHTPGTGDTVTLYAIWEKAISGSVTMGRGATHDINDPMVGDTLTAYPDITPESSSLHYRWLLDGEPIEGATTDTYVVPASDFGKKLSVEVSNDASFSYSVKSHAYTVDANDKYDMPVTFVDAPADPTTFSVKVNDTAVAHGGTVAVVKGGQVTVSLDMGTSTKYVSKLQLGSTTLEETAVKTSNLMDVPATGDFGLTVTFSDSSSGETKTATIDPSADVTAAKNAITAKAKESLPDGQKDRVWVSAFDVVPCWDGNVLKPLAPGEIPAEGLDFTLAYPTGAGYNDTVKANMTKYCNITVYHYKGSTLTEVKTGSGVTVTPSDSITGGVKIEGYKDFSDFGVAATPKNLKTDLNGTVTVSGQTGGKASVGTPLTAEYKSTVATPAGTLSYQWQEKDGSAWKNISGATSASYTPKVPGKTLRCQVKSSFETGEVYSDEIVVSSKPAPKWDRDIINNGGVQTGIVKDVTADMMWAGPSTTQPGKTATWHAISGTTFEVTEPGYYWVRMKDDTECTSVSNSVYVANYYSVICHPDSVSTNRLYFEATSGGTIAGVNGVTLADHPDLIRPTLSDKLYYIKQGGAGATFYARTANSNYYKITAIKAYPTETSSMSKTGKSDYLSVTISKTYTTQPYDVWASAGVYGSKTGDSSHLGLWMELACLSLMGLCAAAVFGRKKLKKQ